MYFSAPAGSLRANNFKSSFKNFIPPLQTPPHPVTRTSRGQWRPNQLLRPLSRNLLFLPSTVNFYVKRCPTPLRSPNISYIYERRLARCKTAKPNVNKHFRVLHMEQDETNLVWNLNQNDQFGVIYLYLSWFMLIYMWFMSSFRSYGRSLLIFYQ